MEGLGTRAALPETVGAPPRSVRLRPLALGLSCAAASAHAWAGAQPLWRIVTPAHYLPAEVKAGSGPESTVSCSCSSALGQACGLSSLGAPVAGGPHLPLRSFHGVGTQRKGQCRCPEVTEGVAVAKEGTALPGHVARKCRPQLEPSCHGCSALGEALNPGSRELC